MKKLLLTEFMTMCKTLKAYTLFLCLCLLLAILGILQLPMITTMTSIIFILLPIGVMFRKKEDTPAPFALRRNIITARYLLVLLMALMAAAFGLSAGVFMSIVRETAAEAALAAVLAAVGTGLFIADILLPVSYTFGVQRTRPYLYPVVVLPLVVLFGGYTPGFSTRGTLSLSTAGYLVLFALLGFGISYVVSRRIAEQADAA